MSEIRVRWTQRVMGREVGHEETVERTPLIEALLANNRVELVQAVVAVSPHTNDLGQVLENVYIDLAVSEDTVANEILSQAISEAEFEIPKPKPRAPRRE